MKFTAIDKKALIRLAASLPAGSQDRRAILRMASEASEPVNPDELLADLRAFARSVPSIRLIDPAINITRGVDYLCEKTDSWWLMDVIAFQQGNRRVAAQPFQVWHLKKSGNGLFIWAEDKNGKKIASQRINHAEFPLPAIKLYCTRVWGAGTAVMLPNEY
jgi:hypothetical protein